MFCKRQLQRLGIFLVPLVLAFPSVVFADTSSTQATVSATVGTVATSTPSTPSGGGGGGGGGTPPPVPNPPSSTPREIDMCDFVCNDNNYEVYMVTPQGNRYGMYSNHAQVFSIGNGLRNVYFDAFDPFGDFNDVALEIDSSCEDTGVYVELTHGEPGPYRVGFLFESDDNQTRHDITLWEDANNAEDYVVRISATAQACSEPAPEEPQITLVLDNIECTDESLLPNGAPQFVVNPQTAATYAQNTDGCTLAAGRFFQWVPGLQSNSTANDIYGFVDGWNNVGPTNPQGRTTVNIPISGLTDISLREVLQTGEVPFSYFANGANNSNNVTAELYCSYDGRNYDNIEWLRYFIDGETRHCIAFNVVAEEDDDPEPVPGDPDPEDDPEDPDPEEDPEDPEEPEEPRIETPPQCSFDCASDQYDLYIIAPDGSERHMGTQFAIVEELSANVNRIYYEDSVGIDRDFNDVVFDIEQYCDRNLLTVNFVSKESTWAHEVWMRVTRNGVQTSNVLLWDDSSQAQGEIGLVGGGQAAYCPERQEELRLRQPLIFEPEIRIGGGDVPANFTANIFSTLIQDTITVSVSATYFENVTIEAVSLRVAGRIWSLRYNTATNNYEVTIPIDELGDQLMTVIVEHDGLVDTYPVTLMSLQPGVILSRADGMPVAGATITLYNALTNEPWDATTYNRINPVVTNNQGQYRFIAPAGDYYLVIEGEGYETRQTPQFRSQNVINETVELLLNDATFSDRSGQFLEDAAGRALEALGPEGFLGALWLAWLNFNEWADNPEVEEVVDTYVAPATVIIPAAAVGPALSTTAVPAVQYAFQYIFLQPLLLFGKKRRRKQWGTVYNSLTKRPIDLAIVRLLDANTKKVVQSRVTDGQGRFFFFAEPGGYVLDVRKPTFTYPSDLLQKEKTDGERLDIYHGEPITVTENDSEVAPNVPIDPADAGKQTIKSIRMRNIWRTLQQVISISSIALAAVAYYITPSVKVLIILCTHIFVYVAFMIYLIPTKPKGWGVVYNKTNKKPVGKAIARLFSVQYNKLIDTQITDRKGRYAFLVGPSTYRVAVEHGNFERTETDPLSLENAKEDDLLVKPHIPLSPGKRA